MGSGKLVAVGVRRLLVRHWTRIAFAATSGRAILAGATGVSVLTLLLFLAAGHVLVAGFAAVFHVAAGFGIIILWLSKSQGGCGNSQGRSHGESDYECLKFSHLYLQIEGFAGCNSARMPDDSEQAVTLSRHTSRSKRHNREGRFGLDWVNVAR